MPGYNYLIPVSDNTNPYFISKGNPELLPTERDNFTVNYNFNNPKTNLNAFVYANAVFTNNDVVQSTVLDDKGVQTNMPVNANGSKSYYLNFNVNKQYKTIQNLFLAGTQVPVQAITNHFCCITMPPPARKRST